MKRAFCLLLSFAALFLLCAPCLADEEGPGEPLIENTRYAYVYNPVFDTVMYEANADKIIYPASTVKMMTAIIAIEYYSGRTDTLITFTEEMLSYTGGTKISYKVGEELTVEQLLYGLVVGNGNDAAYALALSVSGTVEDFVALMNKKAAALGAENTHYTNPTGVDDNKAYTTVRDVAKIAAYAAGMEEYLKYSSCERYDMAPTNMVEARTIANKNYLVSRSYTTNYYLEYATGLNAGSTVKGGECCITSATKNGVSIITVAMNAPAASGVNKSHAFADSVTMLEWAYKAYGYERVLTRSDIVCEIPVRMSGSVDYVSLLPENEVYVFLPLSVDIENDIKREYTLYSEYLTAPVEEGQAAGEMTLFYDGEEVGRVTLVAKNALSRSAGLMVLEFFKTVFVNVWGLVLLILVILISVLAVFATAYRRGKR